MPRAEQYTFALLADPSGVADAILAEAQLDHVRGSQQALLQETREAAAEARTAREGAEVAEQAAAQARRELDRQVAALGRLAEEHQHRLEAAAQRLEQVRSDRAQAEEAARRSTSSAVRAAAAPTAPGVAMTAELAFLLIVFDDGQSGDVDNKIKHTLDALVGLVIEGDEQVQQVTAARHLVGDALDLDDASPVTASVADHLLAGTVDPLVYLRLDPPVRTEELLA